MHALGFHRSLTLKVVYSVCVCACVCLCQVPSSCSSIMIPKKGLSIQVRSRSVLQLPSSAESFLVIFKYQFCLASKISQEWCIPFCLLSQGRFIGLHREDSESWHIHRNAREYNSQLLRQKDVIRSP